MYRTKMSCLLWAALAAVAGCDDNGSVGDGQVPPPDGGVSENCPDWPPDSILQLPRGRQVGPLEVPAGVMVCGQGPDTVQVGRPGGTTVTLGEGSALCNVTVEGGTVGVEARGVARVTLTNVHVRGAAEVGVRLDTVEMAELVDVTISDVGPEGGTPPARGMGHLVVHSSAVGVARGSIGPGTVPGVVVDWADEDAPETCEGQWSGCPFSGAVGLRDVDLGDGENGERFTLAAIKARHGALRISGGRMMAGAPVGRGPDGRAIQADLSSVTIDGDMVIDCGELALEDRIGIDLKSCRVDMADVTVRDCSGGGVRLSRLRHAEGHDVRFPTREDRRFPPLDADGWPLSGREDWETEDEAFDALDWFPDMDWYPKKGFIWPNELEEDALDVALPDPLRSGSGSEGPELDLHLWARGELRDVEVIGCDTVGISIAGHAFRVLRPLVRDMSGPAERDRFGIRVGGNRRPVAVDALDGSTTAFSQIESPRIIDNDARGVDVENTYIGLRRGVELGVWTAHGVRIAGNVDGATSEISRDRRGGLASTDSVASVSSLTLTGNRAFGVLMRGTPGELRDIRVEGVGPGLLATIEEPRQVVEGGHGIVLDASQTNFQGFTLEHMDVIGNTVEAANDVGLLLVTDQDQNVEVTANRPIRGALIDIGYVGGRPPEEAGIIIDAPTERVDGVGVPQ